MSETGIIYLLVVAAWFTLAWQINRRLQILELQLDDRISAIHEQFTGLRDYLYEIDPQFDEERALVAEFATGDDAWAGKILHDLKNEKKSAGKRTLETTFRQ